MGLRRTVETTIHRVAHHRLEFLEGPALGGDAAAQGRRAIRSFLGLRDLKNDLRLDGPNMPCRRPVVNIKVQSALAQAFRLLIRSPALSAAGVAVTDIAPVTVPS